MEDSEDTIYSTMFSSLKHPVRRKILRLLSKKPTGFSQLLEEIGVSSSHLTYHLENLGELVSKTETGDYTLSTFGQAAVGTMTIVEEAPVVQSRQRLLFLARRNSIVGICLIGIVILASLSISQFSSLNRLSEENSLLQSKYDSLLYSTARDKAIRFLRDVIQLDLAKYEATLLDNTFDYPSNLGGIPEQVLRYSFTNDESKIDVVLRFRNNMLSRYQVFLLDGSLSYAEPQPFAVLDSAKWLLEKLKHYENASYLTQMSDILMPFNEANNVEMTQGNMKFNVSVSGTNTEIDWFFTENDVDFVQKGLKLIFENQVLKELDDGYFLYSVGKTQINVDQAGAIQTARDAIKGFTWNANGQVVTDYKVLEEPVSCVFNPIPRDVPLELIPCWYVTLYLDNVYPQSITRLLIIVWADTGSVAQINPLSG